jgi:hypothetical protein
MSPQFTTLVCHRRDTSAKQVDKSESKIEGLVQIHPSFPDALDRTWLDSNLNSDLCFYGLHEEAVLDHRRDVATWLFHIYLEVPGCKIEVVF